MTDRLRGAVRASALLVTLTSTGLLIAAPGEVRAQEQRYGETCLPSQNVSGPSSVLSLPLAAGSGLGIDAKMATVSSGLRARPLGHIGLPGNLSLDRFQKAWGSFTGATTRPASDRPTSSSVRRWITDRTWLRRDAGTIRTSTRHTVHRAISIPAITSTFESRLVAPIGDVAPVPEPIRSSTNVVSEQQGVNSPVDPLRGLAWGLGLGVASDVLESGQRVTGAHLDPRDFVRAEGLSTSTPRFLLESHFYVWNYKRLHIGPTMGVEPVGGDSSLFRAAFLGASFGLQDGERSWNLLVAYLLDFDVEFLADEFVLDRPAPRDRDGVPIDPRTVRRSAGSLLFGTSYSW